MNEEIINKYTDEVLYNRLKGLNIQEKYVKQITENIKEQIYAVISHWNDISFRKGLLIIGQEEALFYKPEADIDIKSFVVIAIRNSLLEVVFSVESNLMELRHPVPEENIKIITSEAIEYFKNIDFNQLSIKIQDKNIKSKYQEIVQKYPIAWEALKQLGNCSGKKAVYEPIKKSNKIDMSDIEKNSENKKSYGDKLIKDEQSGINENFAQGLLKYLKGVLERTDYPIFYVDCFKMVTRNFEKLLKVFEILLENDKMILTSNYYITKGYVSKREKLYRAAHNDVDVIDKWEDPDFLTDLTKTHRNWIKKHMEINMEAK